MLVAAFFLIIVFYIKFSQMSLIWSLINFTFPVYDVFYNGDEYFLIKKYMFLERIQASFIILFLNSYD